MALASSSILSPDGKGTPDHITDVKAKEARRTLVTTHDQLVDVVADLKGTDLVALDLETTGLDPRKDSIRLLSLATKDTTYIADCRSVDPAELLPILTQTTLVTHNILFDLGFLASSGFEPGKVADAMILSQLLHAGATIVPVNKWVGGGQANGELYLNIRAFSYWDGCGPYGVDWKNQEDFEIHLYK